MEPSALDGLSDPIDEVREVLLDVCRARGVAHQSWPSREAVTRVVSDFPECDAFEVAREFEFWARYGGGSLRKIKSPVSTYRTFMKKAEPVVGRTRAQREADDLEAIARLQGLAEAA